MALAMAAAAFAVERVVELFWNIVEWALLETGLASAVGGRQDGRDGRGAARALTRAKRAWETRQGFEGVLPVALPVIQQGRHAMIHPKFGTKFTCFSCAAKFYDMKKQDPKCPKCGSDPKDDPALKASEKGSK